jgi:glucose-6-phosphate-specific signal transduction histidine kinase
VGVTWAEGALLVVVADDGVGGADTRAGTGLRGLSDRVGALGGQIEISSRPGSGTTVRATIPCAAPATAGRESLGGVMEPRRVTTRQRHPHVSSGG